MRNATLIAVEEIKANRFQPRLQFDDKTLQELAESIKENGLLQPIVVRKADKGYEIIAGERRFRACVLAGFKEVPCLIMDPSDLQSAQLALVENIQRENLTSIEEAKAYVKIMSLANITQEKLAEKLGKSQSTIANKIRLLQLPEAVQLAISEKKLSERHARALLSVEKDLQVDTMKRIIDKNLNVRQTEEYIAALKNKEHKPRKVMTKGFTRNIQIGINSINQCLDMIRKTGIVVTSELDENDEDVIIKVKFKK
ncbi:MAG: nucleoid occlusion protein [Erysipelotrichaceae bacterium]|nr:nucleoid occlusion protein [Erysipelotrichaceae bacterium]MDY5253004.1 nucleoid occlusion protein [Erysipelotrichaceae bacterium]